MKLGKVIGRVVSTKKLPCFDGLKLLLVQPLDYARKEAGPAIVAWDTVKAGEETWSFSNPARKRPRRTRTAGSIPATQRSWHVDAVNTEERK
jgi:microcompartment protein CcmK/EutM